jgi:hypothetical protein
MLIEVPGDACSKGGWQSTGVFENQGDCVNDGAKVGAFEDAGSAACAAIPGFVVRDFRLEPTSSWGCAYVPGAKPPDDSYSTSLKAAGASDTNAAGNFSTSQDDTTHWLAICVNQ